MTRYRIKSTVQPYRNYWYVQSRIYDTDTDKVYERKRSTGLEYRGNKRRAAALIPEIEAEILKEFDRPSRAEEPVFAQYVQLWLNKRAKTARENTMDAYKQYAKCHIIPSLGDSKISEMTYRKVQNYYDEKSKTLKSNSLKKQHCVIKGALDEAVRDGLLDTNPADLVEFPKDDKFIGNSYTSEQVEALFQVAFNEGEPMTAVVILATCYGLRREECLGLRWKDIDFEHNTMHICNTVVIADGGVVEAERTKTKKSERTLVLVDCTIPYLKSLKQKQQDNHLTLNKVVRYENGDDVTPNNITRAFGKMLKRNNLPHIRLHDLRHTATSLLNASGVKAKEISEFLGHESVVTTLDIYTNMYDSERAKTAEAMNAIVKNFAKCSAFCSTSPKSENLKMPEKFEK